MVSDPADKDEPGVPGVAGARKFHCKTELGARTGQEGGATRVEGVGDEERIEQREEDRRDEQEAEEVDKFGRSKTRRKHELGKQERERESLS